MDRTMQDIGGWLQSWFGKQHWAAWVISGVGLALAGLSLWYLIIVKALYIGTALDAGLPSLVLRVIEVCLLAGFSLVLVYGGYWLASSPFETERMWWTSLWTMIGLAGVVAVVALVTAVRVTQGQSISEPTLIQEMLLAAGGGAFAGLLIGVSTVRETVEAEQAKQHRNTLLFVNELLRHNVLNGMQIIMGNTDLLREHVDEEGEPLLDTNEQRADAIVALIQDVRALTRSVSGELPCEPVSLSRTLRAEVEAVRTTYPDATVEADVPDGVTVHADELLDTAFENLLANAVEHNDADEPRLEVSVAERSDRAVVRIADNGPGIPDDRKEAVFEPGEQGEGSVGQGVGLYLVRTLVERYGGDVRFENGEPRGTVAVVALPYPS
ncbi:MAG: ATP-binding protein [Haloferacaceae archaeon]